MAEEEDLQTGWAERDPRPFDRRDEWFDPRTDRATLIGVSYRTGRFLADRQQIYRFAAHQTEAMAQWLFGLIGGIDALDEPIIDVGSGNGTYLLPIRHRRAIGLDLSRGMLLGTRAAGFAGPLLESDAQALPIATDCIGTALANHMLYHVPDIAVAVRELRRGPSAGGEACSSLQTRGTTWRSSLLSGTRPLRSWPEIKFRHESASSRFNLDNGAEFLSASFDSVELHHRRGMLFVLARTGGPLLGQRGGDSQVFATGS